MAEDAGFSTLWIADHLAGEVMAAASMPECFTLLGALAEVTQTIGIGVLVANVGTRHPAVLANAAATVQNISGGRFMLGVGAGASPTSQFASELHAIGIPIPRSMAERHDRVEATLDVLDDVWSVGGPDKFATFPKPCPRPPIVLGVNSVALARVASRRADGVNVRSNHERRGEILTASRPHNGRPFTMSVWDYFTDDYVRDGGSHHESLVDDGVDRVILYVKGKWTSKNLGRFRS